VPLRLVLKLNDGRKVLLDIERETILWSPESHAALVELLGPGGVRASIPLAQPRERPKSRAPFGQPAFSG
jgi:hypothetical protein